VNATRRIDTEALRELHLAGRGEIEMTVLRQHRLDHRRVRHGLQRVVQLYAR
jgi:hypothetical protein